MSYDDMQETLRKATDKALEKHFQLEEENAVSRIKSLIKEIHEIASNNIVLERNGYNQIVKITEQLKPVFFPDKIKEKRILQGWVNLYEKGILCHFHRTKKEADEYHCPARIACVRVTGEYEVEV